MPPLKGPKGKVPVATPIPKIPVGLLNGSPSQTPTDATYLRGYRPVDTATPEQISVYKTYRDREKQAADHKTLLANTLRSAIPLPANAQGVVMKKVFNRNDMDDDTFGAADKAVIYKAVDNARKRSGKLVSGTEYEDWKGTMSDDEYEQLQNVVKGHINPVLGTALGVKSPGFRMATTLGRVSYAIDPFSNRAVVTDGYDFTNSYTQDKDGKLKKGYMEGRKDTYGTVRKEFAEDDQGQTAADKERYRVTLRVSPQDTMSLRQRYLGRK